MEYAFSNKMDRLKPSAIREILKFASDPEVISFSAGNPSEETFPVTEIERIAGDILKSNPVQALQYSITEGYTPLRENIQKVILKDEAVMKDGDNLIVVSGAQQGVELTCKVFCDVGDTVICENPSFIGSLNAFKSQAVNLVGVELESDGIHLGKLETALKENPNTKLLYLIPNFQNPSGITMSLDKRKAVLALAEQYDVMIIEDNPYGALRFAGEHIPSLKEMDHSGRVVYCGSFSKLLSPGLRVGYVAANQEVIQKIVVCKQVSDVHTNILAQMICSRFLEECDFDAHVTMLRAVYQRKCTLMLETLEQEVGNRFAFTRPEGGLFVWCTLPDGVDMMAFCKKALDKKVAVVPGSAFLPLETESTQSFRINFSTPSDEDIVKGVRVLGELSKELGSVSRI